MRKRVIVGSIAAGILLLGAIGSAGSQPESTNVQSTQPINKSVPADSTTEKLTPVCDGTSVKGDCELDGIKYTTYIYHPAVKEQSHTETVTTYEKEVTGYCTLCNDGTYSPSCATGSGACSHHGGVAQWNAPRYSSVPKYTTKKVIDTPAKKAYYEKVRE